MTNEEIVLCVRKGAKSKDYLQMLYENNLPAIKAICRKYAPYAEMEDLMQEAFLGLVEAVNHYDSCNEVKFMTYAHWWIRQSVIRHIEKCGSCLCIPINIQEDILKYKKCVENYQKNNGRTPTEKEISDIMKISVKRARELMEYSQPLASLDAPLEADEELCFCDALAGVSDTENEVIEDIHKLHTHKILWKVIDETMTAEERHIVKEYFINNKSTSKIADELGITASKARTIRNNGLRKLSTTRVKRKLANDLEIYESRMYHTGIKPFRISLTSTVESIVMQRENN